MSEGFKAVNVIINFLLAKNYCQNILMRIKQVMYSTQDVSFKSDNDYCEVLLG